MGVECSGSFFSVVDADVGVEWATKVAGSNVGVEWSQKARKWVRSGYWANTDFTPTFFFTVRRDRLEETGWVRIPSNFEDRSPILRDRRAQSFFLPNPFDLLLKIFWLVNTPLKTR